MKPAVSGFPLSTAPHLRTSETLTKIFLGRTAALLPLLILSLILFKLQALMALSVVLLGAFASEFLCAQIFKRKMKIGAHSFWTPLVFFLLLPSSFPAAYLVAGIFVSVFSRELFGGCGASVVSAVLVGNAFLQLNAPSFFRAIASGVFFLDGSGIGAWLTLLALCFGAAILLWRKIIEWEIPLIYIAILFLLEEIFPAAMSFSARRVIFAAFFLLNEPGTSPLTRTGRRIAALLAGLLTWNLDAASSMPLPEIFAILGVNLMTSWLDQWILPAGIRARKRKAA